MREVFYLLRFRVNIPQLFYTCRLLLACWLELFGKEWLKLLTDVTIQVPDGMVMYLKPQDQHTELVRNALLLYPYINNDTISHGKAAEILGITKYDLIELYDSLGLAYLSMDISEVEEELDAWEKLKGEGI